MKLKKILYFIQDGTPTAAEVKDSMRYPSQICFRNASVIDSSQPIEPCDGVAGMIPEQYADMPTAAEAIADAFAQIETAMKGLSDQPAPKQTAPAQKKTEGQLPTWGSKTAS